LCEVVGIGSLNHSFAEVGARWRPTAPGDGRRRPAVPSVVDGPRWREVARLRRPQRRVALSIHSRDGLMRARTSESEQVREVFGQAGTGCPVGGPRWQSEGTRVPATPIYIVYRWRCTVA